MIVAILGQMRSGTSLLASIVHHLGYPVAITMGAPIPPTWDFDWEDQELTEMLMLGEPDQRWFERYLAGRGEASSRLGTDGDFAVKSPYLALHWEPFVRAADRLGADLCVFMTDRRQDAIDISLAGLPVLSSVDQACIRAALRGIASDMTIRYEALLSHGKQRVLDIADRLDVIDEEAVERATAQIRRKRVAVCR